MPSERRIIRNNLPGWSESFDLKESVVPADPIQKERDLVARGFVQSRPVIHMVHGINQILEDHEKEHYALGDEDWLLVLLWNCEILIWEAIEHAKRWRILSGGNRMPMIAPELMIDIVSQQLCAQLTTENQTGKAP